MNKRTMLIQCDKCGGKDVLHFSTEKPQEPIVQTMTEVSRGASPVYCENTVYTYTEMAMLCKDCGYRMTYTY